MARVEFVGGVAADEGGFAHGAVAQEDDFDRGGGVLLVGVRGLVLHAE